VTDIDIISPLLHQLPWLSIKKITCRVNLYIEIQVSDFIM